ncbi:MAG: alpha/beta hydrolase [Patescibacteria group bacterium]
MKKYPLVVLHGWGLSGERFAPLVTVLERLGYTVYAPDLPGFGKSQMPSRPLTLTDYCVFLDTYVKDHRLTQPVLLGHSFGGRVALKFNQLYPQRVSALILTGVPGFTPIPKRRLSLFIFLAKLGGFLFAVPPMSLFQEQVKRWYYYVVGAKDFFLAEGAMRETFKRIVAEDLVDCMAAVSIPTLLVWGELDIIIPPSIAERMHRAIEGSQLVIIPDSDHGVSFKEPEKFVPYVTRFLESL